MSDRERERQLMQKREQLGYQMSEVANHLAALNIQLTDARAHLTAGSENSQSVGRVILDNVEDDVRQTTRKHASLTRQIAQLDQDLADMRAAQAQHVQDEAARIQARREQYNIPELERQVMATQLPMMRLELAKLNMQLDENPPAPGGTNYEIMVAAKQRLEKDIAWCEGTPIPQKADQAKRRG